MGICDVVAENIRRIRQRKRLTQARLARLAGVDRTYINNIERTKANPTIDVVEKIAGALNVSIIDLLSESNVAINPSTSRSSSKLNSQITSIEFQQLHRMFGKINFISKTEFSEVTRILGDNIDLHMTPEEATLTLNAHFRYSISGAFLEYTALQKQLTPKRKIEVANAISSLLLKLGYQIDISKATYNDFYWTLKLAKPSFSDNLFTQVDKFTIENFKEHNSTVARPPPDIEKILSGNELAAAITNEFRRKNFGAFTSHQLPYLLYSIMIFVLNSPSEKSLSSNTTSLKKIFSRLLLKELMLVFQIIYDFDPTFINSARSPETPTIKWAKRVIRLAATHMTEAIESLKKDYDPPLIALLASLHNRLLQVDQLGFRTYSDYLRQGWKETDPPDPSQISLFRYRV
jgi:transcriptional regulator with XRE-family HTH domain